VIITVVYGRVRDMDAARRCPRCDSGRERYGPQAGRPCPRCEGTGIRPEGWAYLADDALGLAIGDLVETPPTPYSSGNPKIGTVVDVNGAVPSTGKPMKTIIGRAEVTS